VRTDRKVLLVLGLFMGIMGAAWTIGPIVFAGRDDPTAIDSKAVRPTVETSCTQLRNDLAAVPADLAPPERAEAENRAVEQFLGRIRALGHETLAKDEPVERWLGDWELIVTHRRDALRDGKRFSTPFVEGTPVNVRMFSLIRSGLRQCDVPAALLVAEPGRV